MPNIYVIRLCKERRKRAKVKKKLKKQRLKTVQIWKLYKPTI